MAYRAISKGVSLAAAHANYLAWLAQNPGQRSAAYQKIAKSKKDKVIKTAGYLIPFGINVYSKIALATTVLSSDQSSASNSALATTVYNALATRINPSVTGQTGWNFDASLGKHFKFAKFSVIQVTSVATQKSNSRITNNLYQKNVTSTVTGDFGQDSVTPSTYPDSVTAILANEGIVTLLASTTNKARYRFKEEGT